MKNLSTIENFLVTQEDAHCPLQRTSKGGFHRIQRQRNGALNHPGTGPKNSRVPPSFGSPDGVKNALMYHRVRLIMGSSNWQNKIQKDDEWHLRTDPSFP